MLEYVIMIKDLAGRKAYLTKYGNSLAVWHDEQALTSIDAIFILNMLDERNIKYDVGSPSGLLRRGF